MEDQVVEENIVESDEEVFIARWFTGAVNLFLIGKHFLVQKTCASKHYILISLPICELLVTLSLHGFIISHPSVDMQTE